MWLMHFNMSYSTCQVQIPFICAGYLLFLMFNCLKIWSHPITWSYTKVHTNWSLNMPSWGKFRGREVMLAMMNLELALERAMGYDLMRQKELFHKGTWTLGKSHKSWTHWYVQSCIIISIYTKYSAYICVYVHICIYLYLCTYIHIYIIYRDTVSMNIV